MPDAREVLIKLPSNAWRREETGLFLHRPAGVCSDGRVCSFIKGECGSHLKRHFVQKPKLLREGEGGGGDKLSRNGFKPVAIIASAYHPSA